MKWITLLFLGITLGIAACEEEDEAEGGDDCYVCDNCTQFPNQLNGREYCVSGFDNRADWEANRATQENESGCTCE